MAPGRLVAFEGGEAAGKSTQAALLAERLGAVLTFEPGATRTGEVVRRHLLDPDAPLLAPRAETLLVLADRAQHCWEQVRPALAGGRWVVTDRFSGSTLAYQGHGLGMELPVLQELCDWASSGTWPDLTVLLTVEPAEAARRLAVSRPDRIEARDQEFHRKVAEGYLQLASGSPESWVVVDGSGPASGVASAVADAVTARLGWPEGASR
ncbi:MAG: dTMP kinase [Acidimicrobiales bacterium]